MLSLVSFVQFSFIQRRKNGFYRLVRRFEAIQCNFLTFFLYRVSVIFVDSYVSSTQALSVIIFFNIFYFSITS